LFSYSDKGNVKKCTEIFEERLSHSEFSFILLLRAYSNSNQIEEMKKIYLSNSNFKQNINVQKAFIQNFYNSDKIEDVLEFFEKHIFEDMKKFQNEHSWDLHGLTIPRNKILFIK
jgi:uncharacterized radical SAM superfamily Fe-S cluster-containing enzyme